MADCCVKTMLEDAATRLSYLHLRSPLLPQDVLSQLGEISRCLNQSIGWLGHKREGRCRECKAKEASR